MRVIRAYKVELDPTAHQRTAFMRHAGAARWAYNWGLARKIETYRTTGKSPSAVDLHRELNRLKGVAKEDGGVPWMYEVSKCAPQEALRNLEAAFKGFFRRCKAGSGAICATIHDRDVNAARNLKKLAGSSPVTACGEPSSGSDAPPIRTKLDSTNQEQDIVFRGRVGS